MVAQALTIKVTFRKSFLGENIYKTPQNESVEEIVSDYDEQDEEEDEKCLVIRITREEKIRMRRLWRQTLIIKEMGRTIGYTYTYLLRRIKALWHPNSHIELIAILGLYVLVKFSSLDDYNYAKYEGTWMVLDHYLIVK